MNTCRTGSAGSGAPGSRPEAEYLLHDLNNMLNPIQGYSRMIMDKTHPGDIVHDYARQIGLAARKVKLLSVSIIRSGRHGKGETFETIELSAFLFELDGLIHGILPDNVTAEITSAGKSHITGCSILLERAFLNIVLNACEAMPCGGKVKIIMEEKYLEQTVKAIGAEIPQGAYAVVSFTDNGIGIEPEAMELLFKTSFTTKPSGNGIGLASVFQVLRQHNAYVTVESVPGKGTSFKVYFQKTVSIPSHMGPVKFQHNEIHSLDMAKVNQVKN